MRLSPSTTLREHRRSGLPWRRLRVLERWTPGPGAGHAGPWLLSVNEYRPHRAFDLLALDRLSRRLGEQALSLPECAGLVLGYQPLGRVTVSLSAWTTEEGLRRFVLLSDHRRAMREWRERGYLRHVHWWGGHRWVGQSLAEAHARLDRQEGSRAGEPHSPVPRAL